MGHDSEPSYVLALGIVVPILCIAIVAARVFTRVKQGARLGADDWLAIAALVMVVGCGICLIIGVALRVMGYPTPPLDDPTQPNTSSNYNIQVITKLEWSILIFQGLALGLVKASFVFFYRRIFVIKQKRPRGRFDIITWIVIAVLFAWSIAFLFATLVICKGNWAALWTNLETLTTECVDTSKLLLALAVSDFLLDVVVLCLPLHKIFRLRMTWRRKLGVLFVFALGFVAIVMSIMRLYVFVWGTRVSFTDEDIDNNLLITRVLYWNVLEVGLALVACCLPTISSFLQTTTNATVQYIIRPSTSCHSLISLTRHRNAHHPSGADDDAEHVPPRPVRSPYHSVLSDGNLETQIKTESTQEAHEDIASPPKAHTINTSLK